MASELVAFSHKSIIYLKQRPMPTEAHRATMLRPEDVAECVMLAVNLPPRAVVQELLIRPCR